MINSVSSDSSMYICLVGDLKDTELLDVYLSSYSFYIGRKVINEIKKTMRIYGDFLSKVTIIEFNYYELIKPLFFRKEKHLEDGEYEVIGIAYYLNYNETLGYLVLDEKRARNFVQKNFPELFDKLVGTIGFVRDSCIKDKKIGEKRALAVLNSIKKAVENSKEKRPCSLDVKNYEKILIPTIDLIQRGIRD